MSQAPIVRSAPDAQRLCCAPPSPSPTSEGRLQRPVLSPVSPPAQTPDSGETGSASPTPPTAPVLLSPLPYGPPPPAARSSYPALYSAPSAARFGLLPPAQTTPAAAPARRPEAPEASPCRRWRSAPAPTQI